MDTFVKGRCTRDSYCLNDFLLHSIAAIEIEHVVLSMWTGERSWLDSRVGNTSGKLFDIYIYILYTPRT